MSFFAATNPCPCESGLEYDQCCANPENKPILFSQINQHGESDSPLTTELETAIQNFCTRPDLFPVNIDTLNNSSELAKMSPFWFSESVFLDSPRIMGKCRLTANLHWIKKQADNIDYQTTPYIFHTAFCGSTLISKALELTHHCLPIREPDLLAVLLNYSYSENTFPEIESQWYTRITNLLSRRFEPDVPAVIKANDYANPILHKILEYRPQTPVLLMYIPLQQFVASCVKIDSRKQWIQDRIRANYYRFMPALQVPEEQINFDQDIGKLAAVYWCYSIYLFQTAIENYGDHIKT
ncbi:MAG: SEC-C domain-containing protein, partial [Gammaproteobacteria bacterium]|nr:SEC-C domain-containing protein [Gammaproteobacteria bacterium]